MLFKRHGRLRTKLEALTLKSGNMGGENCEIIAASLLRITFINSIVGT